MRKSLVLRFLRPLCCSLHAVKTSKVLRANKVPLVLKAPRAIKGGRVLPD